MWFEIPRILDLFNVVMRTVAWFYNVYLYIYDVNILEYAQTLAICGSFIVLHIEGHSSIQYSKE